MEVVLTLENLQIPFRRQSIYFEELNDCKHLINTELSLSLLKGCSKDKQCYESGREMTVVHLGFERFLKAGGSCWALKVWWLGKRKEIQALRNNKDVKQKV